MAAMCQSHPRIRQGFDFEALSRRPGLNRGFTVYEFPESLLPKLVRELAQELVKPTPGQKGKDGKPKAAVSGRTASPRMPPTPRAARRRG